MVNKSPGESFCSSNINRRRALVCVPDKINVKSRNQHHLGVEFQEFQESPISTSSSLKSSLHGWTANPELLFHLFDKAQLSYDCIGELHIYIRAGNSCGAILEKGFMDRWKLCSGERCMHVICS